MKIPKITELVNPNGMNRVIFSRYADGELWYEVVDQFQNPLGFEFPVAVSDCGNGTFLAQDKAILFMRWIRKRIELLEEWTKKSSLSPETPANSQKLS